MTAAAAADGGTVHRKSSNDSSCNVSGTSRRNSKTNSSSILEEKEGTTVNATFLHEAVDIETRLRQHILELLEPTIRKQGILETKLRENQAVLNNRTDEMKEVWKVRDNAEQIHLMVDSIRAEMAEWDKDRRSHDETSGNRLSEQEAEIHNLRRTLEQFSLQSSGVNRTLKGLGDTLVTAREENTQLRSYTVDRLDMNRDICAKLRNEFELRMSAVENQMHQLQDAQSSTNDVVNSTCAIVTNMTKRVTAADNNIADIWRTKASVANLEEQQRDLAEFMRHVNGVVSGLKLQFGSLVVDVKSHFQEAANVVGTTTATMMEDLRRQYKDELHRVDIVQGDIKAFVGQASSSQKETKAEVAHIREDARNEIDGLQKSVEQIEKRRQLGERNIALEVAQLRHSIAEMNTHGHSQEGSSGIRGDILKTLVESQFLSALLDNQDEHDRKNIALFGYKSAGGGKEKSCSLPDVQGTFRGRGGTMSARSPPKRGVAQGFGGTAAPSDNANAAGAGVGQVLSLDKRCLSCSGSQETVLAGFKMACLSYAPGQIEVGNTTYSRSELICQRLDMLRHAQEQLTAGSIE